MVLIRVEKHRDGIELMAVPAVSGALKKYWVVLVIVVALFSAGVVVARLRTFFDSDQPLAPDVGHADAIVPFNVKRVNNCKTGNVVPRGTHVFIELFGILDKFVRVAFVIVH